MMNAFVFAGCLLASLSSVPDDAVRTPDLSISTDRYFYEATMPVRVSVALAKPVPTDSVAALKVSSPDGKTVYSVQSAFKALDCSFRLPAGLWAFGNGQVAVSVASGGKELMTVAKSVRILKPRTRQVDVLTVKDGIPHLKGKPFFAKIFHHMGPIVRDPKMPRGEILKMAEAEFAEMREMGINLVVDMSFVHQVNPVEKHLKFHSIHEGWLGPSHRAYRNAGLTFRDLCDLAAKYGIAVSAEIPFITSFRKDSGYSQEEFDCFADEISFARDCDNMILWHPQDETDSLIAQNLLRRRLYAEADPGRITWSNFTHDFAWNKEASEILSADPYPISPKDKDLSRIGRDADALRPIVTAPDRAMWFWIQNFGAEPPIWPRPPTPRELRAMTYLALNHGAKGLAYFTYCTQKERDGVRQDPATIPELTQINAEIRRDENLWLSGCRRYAGCVNGIDLAVIESGDVRRFSYVNGTPTNQVAHFEIPGVGVRNIAMAAFEQKIVDEPVPDVAEAKIVPDEEPLAENLLAGCNVDFSKGAEGWLGKGTNWTKVVTNAEGKAWIRTAGRDSFYRKLPKRIYAPGDRLVALCRVRAVEGDARGPARGAGLTWAIWSADWKKIVELHARTDDVGKEWTRVVGDPMTIPEWASPNNELHLNLQKSRGSCEISDVALCKAFVPATLYVHLPKGIERVRLVNGRGEAVYDSGLLSGSPTSFAHRLDLFTPHAYRLTAISPDGTGITAELKPSEPCATGRAYEGMPPVRTVPHQLDALVKGGHIQGFCCSDEGIYLSHSMGIEMVGWDGKLIRRVDAPVHLGDSAYADGKVYGAFCFWHKRRDGSKGAIRVWDSRLNQISEKPFKDQLDGITVLNGKIYVGVVGPKNLHRGCRVKVLDMNLNELQDVEIDFGYDIAYGVQTMSTLGDELIFGNYGGTSIVSADLKTSRKIQLRAGEGIDRVPASVVKSDAPLYVVERSENGGMRKWMEDPSGHPPVVRLDFLVYTNGNFNCLSPKVP